MDSLDYQEWLTPEINRIEQNFYFRISMKTKIFFIFLLFGAVGVSILLVNASKLDAQQNWRGLVVAPENRCAPYNRKAYPYSQSVEDRIIAQMGAIYGPYTGTFFSSKRQTDIEHIVAAAEAHDSGLCAASPAVKSQFASDLLNLTLASPQVNRHQKKHYDAAEWQPQLNQCWYANRIVEVKRKYKLTVDVREAQALEEVLSNCASTDMIVVENRRVSASSSSVSGSSAPTANSSNSKALELWDDNGNGRITCKEARRHGIAPVQRDHPAYEFMRDGDGDGIVCE